MIELRAVRGSRTGPELVELLRGAGVAIGTVDSGAGGVVSYGVTVSGVDVPVLNANAGVFNKFEELACLSNHGLLVPPFSLDGSGLEFPILGRRFKHSKARDIIAILQNDREFEWRRAGRASDYFVHYVPIDREFRVWGYRQRPLATYEKMLRWPERYRAIGRNFDNGFAFEFVAEPMAGLKELGCAAIHALDLDFGAADILLGMDGLLYVLEVNTAPGVQGSRQCTTALARKIARWEQLGYPRRNR